MNALGYAKLAQNCYNVPPTIGQSDSASRAVIDYTDDGEVVVFRGSDDLASWMEDLEADPHFIYGLGRVHEGFWEAFRVIRAPLMLRTPAIVSGHSLGAALAIIYAAELCMNGKPPKAIYAFEPPRVSCDDTIAQLLREHGVQCYLYRNGSDPVPELPIPIPLFAHWQHPCELLQIGNKPEAFPEISDHMIGDVIAALG